MTLTNQGNASVQVSLPESESFVITGADGFADGIAEIGPGETAVFTVCPKLGLLMGDHAETLTVTYGSGLTVSVNASFKVNAPKETEKETEKTTEKTTEKETEKETEKTTEKETEKETEKTTEKETEQATEKETEQETEQATEKATEPETEKTGISQKGTQTITTGKKTYTYTYKKNRKFSLKASAKTKLSYKSSNKKVVKVSSSGKVTIVGYGTAKITITAAESSACEKAVATVTVKIKPVKAAIKSVTAGQKKFTVKFKKDTKASGYQIQYSTSRKFSKSKTKTVKVKKSVSAKTIKGLKKNKKYYVRMRAYTTVGKKTLYGSWSKTKSVTVK